MAIDHTVLANELTSDPLVRGYAGMNDKQATDDLNTAYRDGPADPMVMLQYCTLERFRSGTIFGRLMLLALARPVRAGNSWEIAPLPLGVADADVVPTQKHITSAQAFLRYLDVDNVATITLLDARFDTILDDLTDAGGGIGVMGGGDKTNLQALSQNRQTRAFEIEVGGVPKEYDVHLARQL